MNSLVYNLDDKGYLVTKCPVNENKYVGGLWCVEECKHFRKRSAQTNVIFCEAEIKKGTEDKKDLPF